ncbi:hypothetical protein [Siccirubricoccus sp. G192]|uniref:hypothetical protein n=1 Tax=Siccirubricoccus sp. G192 TaxID=2849651 RepID=UPI001C2C9FE4|nr:hypothetical protein [Siccirubricoccus sp. G192]MBV1795977.1 hypothetical protein [Siccirubricoccus sp. G192]
MPWRIGSEVVAIRPVLLVNTAESLRAAAIAGIGPVPVPTGWWRMRSPPGAWCACSASTRRR